MRSVRRQEAGLVDKKSVCTGSSGTQPCLLFLVIVRCLKRHFTGFVADRVIELATVEPQISLQEQSSLTPASGTYSVYSAAVTEYLSHENES